MSLDYSNTLVASTTLIDSDQRSYRYALGLTKDYGAALLDLYELIGRHIVHGPDSDLDESSNPDGLITLNGLDTFYSHYNDSLRGPQGYTGVQGGTGIQGPTGGIGLNLQGPTGRQGSAGAQGRIGYQGPVGIQGASATGSGVGVQGPTGSKGFTGKIGIQGPKGASGFTPQASSYIGPQGIAGTNGSKGYLGPHGYQGRPGADVIGIQGPTGANGLIGSQGPTGAQGLTGKMGTQGPTGSQGSTGSTGFGYTITTADILAEFTNHGFTFDTAFGLNSIDCSGSVSASNGFYQQ